MLPTMVVMVAMVVILLFFLGCIMLYRYPAIFLDLKPQFGSEV